MFYIPVIFQILIAVKVDLKVQSHQLNVGTHELTLRRGAVPFRQSACVWIQLPHNQEDEDSRTVSLLRPTNKIQVQPLRQS